MAKDILLDADGDLLIENGDLKVSESDQQEIETILKLNKGDLKRDPVLGCNLMQLINSDISEVEIKQRIKLNLERDGKKINSIGFNNGVISID